MVHFNDKQLERNTTEQQFCCCRDFSDVLGGEEYLNYGATL